MTEIDTSAFEAGEESCSFGQDDLSVEGSAPAAHFSDTVGSIYVTAHADLRSARPQAGHAQPTLTVVVEDSADGASWATVATFEFSASGDQAAAVDSPRAYLRVSWVDIVGTWSIGADVESIAAPSSGGGSQPSVSDGLTDISAASAFLFPSGTVSEPTPGTAAIDHLVKYTTVILEAADILALDSTPFTLLDGVDASAIVPLQSTIRLRFGSAPYSANPGFRAFIGSTFGTSGWGAIMAFALPLAFTEDRAAFGSFSDLEGDAEPLTLLDGQPLRIDISEAVTDGDGSLEIAVSYVTLSLT